MRLLRQGYDMADGKKTAVWYNGSNLRLTVLRAGSTVTKDRALAEAFSHKPSVLCRDDDGTILHNGTEHGFLYLIDEPVSEGVDCCRHPRSSMEPGLEFLTQRPLPLRLVDVCPPPDETKARRAAQAIRELLRTHHKE